MRRVLLVVAIALVALVALPPLWFVLSPQSPPALPPASRSIAVGEGAGVSALDRGNGPPVVLVHGLPGSGHDWSPLVEALAARGHRAIAYDRVGYGRSDARSDGDYTPDANARELLALLEAEELADATIVGWSYGGAAAIRAARADPSRIGRLVLVGSAGPWPEAPEDPAIFAVLFSGPVMAWMAAVPPVARSLQRAISAQAFHPEPIPSWWHDQLAANFASPHTSQTYRAEGARFEWSEALDPASIDRPILVVHGDADLLVPIEVGRQLAARARDSRLEIVGGGGHMLPITRPGPLAAWISAFAARR